jgi:hypothetical protein
VWRNRNYSSDISRCTLFGKTKMRHSGCLHMQ